MDEKKPDPVTPICTCVQDPFANLPSELRPKRVDEMGGLRKVTCPGCELTYWTNRKTDVCIEYEKKGIRLPEMQQEGVKS
jgi:hypothetical protein